MAERKRGRDDTAMNYVDASVYSIRFKGKVSPFFSYSTCFFCMRVDVVVVACMLSGAVTRYICSILSPSLAGVCCTLIGLRQSIVCYLSLAL